MVRTPLLVLALTGPLAAGPALAQAVAPVAAPLSAYAHAAASLGLWALILVGLTILSVAVPYGARTPSGHPVRDYDDRGYRAHRAHQNALETSAPFLAALGGAVLVGASPFWVNLFASVFVVSRLGMVAIHVGTTNQPARSAAWSVGMICVLGLALIALVGAVL